MDVPLHHPSDCASLADDRPAPPLDVPALTRRMVEGDESAYRTFHDAYFDRLCRYLLVITGGDEQAAREALQAALVRMVRYIKVFADDATFWSWLTVVARSARSDESRKRRRYLAFLDRFTQHTASESAGPDLDSTDEQLRALLDRNVELLPPDERQLVEWKYFEHRSVREIAVDLQTTEKAVESRLVRIRRKLKDAVFTELKDEPTGCQ